jgi:hypothetical protein
METCSFECLSWLRRFIESDLFAALSSGDVDANCHLKTFWLIMTRQDGPFLRPFGPHFALNGEIHFGHKVSRKASFPGPARPAGPPTRNFFGCRAFDKTAGTGSETGRRSRCYFFLPELEHVFFKV